MEVKGGVFYAALSAVGRWTLGDLAPSNMAFSFLLPPKRRIGWIGAKEEAMVKDIRSKRGLCEVCVYTPSGSQTTMCPTSASAPCSRARPLTYARDVGHSTHTHTHTHTHAWSCASFHVPVHSRAFDAKNNTQIYTAPRGICELVCVSGGLKRNKGREEGKALSREKEGMYPQLRSPHKNSWTHPQPAPAPMCYSGVYGMNAS